jgi:very-short-patch-repair endonuclease
VHDLHALLGPPRTTSVAMLSAAVSERTVARWLAAGRLVRLHPGWVTAAEFAEDWTVRAHAATAYAGGPLSHMSALAVHGVVDREVTRLSVTVPGDRRVRTSRWLRVHRSRNALEIVRARGLPATTIARSLVDTWGDAHRARAVRGYGDVARAAVLRGTRDRRVSNRELAAELRLRPELPSRAELVDLLDLIAAGCQSELEIFGVRHVLAVPGLPRFRQQHRVILPGGPVLLDAAWPEVKLAVELDGAAFHGGQEARERDLRRDAALAAQGWLVLRFSYRRLTRHPDACRAQIAAAYRARLTVVP